MQFKKLIVSQSVLKTVFALLICAMWSVYFTPLKAADCADANITLTTQAEVDNFQAVYGNCDVVTSSLTIGPSNDITNLDALIHLNSIEEVLYIEENTQLTNLDGLENLNHITVMHINNNQNITDFDALSNLTSIGSIYIENNPKLASLSGFMNIITIIGQFFLTGNPALSSLQGLENLVSTGDFHLSGSPLIPDFEPLSNLTTISSIGLSISGTAAVNLDALSNITNFNGYLHINGHGNLTNVDGLSNITQVTDLDITNNPLLTNLDGLSNLTSVESHVTIRSNEVLTNIDGLMNLPNVINGNLWILENNAITHLEALSNLTSVEGELIIAGNSQLTSCCAILSALDNNIFPLLYDNAPCGNCNNNGIDVQATCINENDVYDALDAALNITNVSCAGGDNGYAVVEVSGGTPPYTYLWSNGVMGNNVAGLLPGPISVVVTDAANCSVTKEGEISEPAPITLDNVSILPPNMFNLQGVVLTICGGTPPYNTSWNASGYVTKAVQIDENNCLQMTVKYKNGATWAVEVTDLNGCTFTYNSSTETENLPPNIGSYALTKASNCTGLGGDGEISIDVIGGTPPYTYAWEGAACPCPNAATITGLTSGWYSVVVTDAMGKITAGNYWLACCKPGRTCNNKVDLGNERYTMTTAPNPFSEQTTLDFMLDDTGMTTLAIYNISGQRVATLFDEMATAQQHYQVVFDAQSLPEGIYLARLSTAQGNVQTKRLILVK